jgi:Protein of unknown function (DUF664)
LIKKGPLILTRTRYGQNPDKVQTKSGVRAPLRSVLVHMIEEYARHCGHADRLRERIDGRVGQ